MTVAVIDYGSGNLRSVAKALASAGAEVQVTDDPDCVRRAERIVLPGVGAFADCAQGLAARPGLSQVLHEQVIDAGRPFLGICVGMQLMAARGLEYGATPGFGWVTGEIAKLPTRTQRLPHMGWNELAFTPGAHKLLDGLQPGDHAYFVHSYALAQAQAEQVIATTDYDGHVVAMVAAGNRAGGVYGH